MENIFSYLSQRPYPGRGILIGRTPDNKPVAAYFIMGRSENSRNRVFSVTEDGIETKAADPAKLTDPSLIIYRPVRRFRDIAVTNGHGDTNGAIGAINANDAIGAASAGGEASSNGGSRLIVTNGDQTDTIYDFFTRGECYRKALKTREFEPDAPNYTPRISAVDTGGNYYALSILKTLSGDPSCCVRNFYEYENPKAGTGHFISTYQGFGDPIPSFEGEPLTVEITDTSAGELAKKLWDSLDTGNRVSLYVNLGGEVEIINKYTE